MKECMTYVRFFLNAVGAFKVLSVGRSIIKFSI